MDLSDTKCGGGGGGDICFCRKPNSSWKVNDDGSSNLSGLAVKLYHDILYDNFTGFKEAVDKDDFHRSRHNDKHLI